METVQDQEDFGNEAKCDNCGNEWGPMATDEVGLVLCEECLDEHPDL